MSDPVCISNCADCGIGCITTGEWFSVFDDVWEEQIRIRPTGRSPQYPIIIKFVCASRGS